MADLESQIRELWERADRLDPSDTETADVVRSAVAMLDRGEARVAELRELGGMDWIT